MILDAPVHEIDQSSSRTIMRTGNRAFEANRVVVALTPSGCRTIRFRPELPTGRRRLQDSWIAVSGRKIHVSYPEPFWRTDGLSGSGFTDLDAAPGVVDVSPPDASAGVLAIYLTVEPNRPPARQDQVLAALTEILGRRAQHIRLRRRPGPRGVSQPLVRR